MSGVKWTDEQRKAIDARGHTLLISAAAGSGKTAVIVERLLSRVTQDSCNINEFLIITYTKAAANELRAKISEALSDRIAQNPDNMHLQRQPVLLHIAKISTIHAYCSSLIKEHSHVLGVKPSFRIADEDEADIIRRGVLDEIIEERYASKSEDFYAVVETLGSARSDERVFEVVVELHTKSLSHPFPQEWLERAAGDYDAAIRDVADTKWGRVLIENAFLSVEGAISAAEYAIGRIQRDAVLSVAYLPAFESDLHKLCELRKCIYSSWDAAAEFIGAFSFDRLGQSRNVEDKALVSLVKGLRDGYKNIIKKLSERCFTKRSKELADEISMCRGVVRELVSIVSDLESRFSAEKDARGIMTYSDLEHNAIRLLVRDYDEEADVVTRTELAEHVSKEFIEILLDEFQDSNGTQDMLFRALSRQEKNIVMVGDVKQSIYRFRLADPSIFMKKYKSFPVESDVPDMPRCITLSKNFRSRAQVLTASNSVFSRIMSEQLGDIDYTPREYLYPGLEYQAVPEQSNNTQLVVIDLEGSPEDENEDFEAPERLSCEGGYIAGKIRAMIDEGFLVTDKDGGGLRPVKYSDFVILMRSAKGKSVYYEKALAENGIPYSSEKTQGLLETVEARVMTAMLAIIDNPLRDIPLISVLKSQLFGFDADDLCYIRRAGGRELYYALKENARYDGEDARRRKSAEKCREFATLLDELRDFSIGTETDRLLWHIYNRTNALGLFGAMQNGRIRQRNLITLFRHAQSFESLGYRGVYQFNAHLTRIVERGGDLAEEPTDTQGLDTVKIMTIHKSKGLEFPVVFLAECCRKLNLEDARRAVLQHPEYGIGLTYRDAESMTEHATIAKKAIASVIEKESKSEEIRVLYVAMTRAREKLFLICSLKRARKRLQGLFEQSLGSDAVMRSVLTDASTTEPWLLIPMLKSKQGKPLRAYAEISEYELEKADDFRGFEVSVVSAAEITSNSPERPQDMAEVSERVPRDTERTAELTRRFMFEYPYSEAESAPSKVTATELFGYREKEIDQPLRAFKQPRFVPERTLTPAERGTALHLAMQFIDFGKCGTLTEIKDELLRLREHEFLTDEQYAAVDPSNIFDFFNSDIGREVLCAQNLRREFKFSILAPADELLQNPLLNGEKILFQGVIDLVFENERGVTLLDFKTDRIKSAPPPELLRQYGTQINAYAYALKETSGIAANRKILYFISAGISVEI